jgi:hypothetical protein
MKLRQWEIWKARPEGFTADHWFVLISGQERLDSSRMIQVNGLACFTLRGQPLEADVRLNSAEGFPSATICQCDLVYFLDKRKLHSPLGLVSWERQQQIKSKIKELLRF